MFILKLAVVPFLLEKLDMVMLAVEFSLMCNVVGWANSTTSMGTLKTAPMVWGPIYCNLEEDHRPLFRNVGHL